MGEMKYDVELAMTGSDNCYDNKWDWPIYNGPIIRLDPSKINKGKRRKIRISMVMDENGGSYQQTSNSMPSSFQQNII
jgi:hypothetical protein